MKREEERLVRWSVGLEGEAMEELCYRRHHLRFIDHSLCGGGGERCGGECVDRTALRPMMRALPPAAEGGRLSSLNRVGISYLETLR